MEQEKGFIHVLVVFLIIIVGVFLFSAVLNKKEPLTNLPMPTSTSTPTPDPFPYKPPTIKKNNSYRMLILGDSIVNTLGVNANRLREMLIGYYPDSEFVTYNYGYPSTNVLSLYDRFTNKTRNGGEEKEAAIKLEVELIVIESFGYNPLSEYPLEEGLKKQTEELDRSVRLILTQKPNVALAFLTPIAPDPVNFAKTTRNLTPEVRKKWVEERVAYINNHKKYAQEKGIPVIDVYTLSLKANGEVDRGLISSDFIHPSAKGVDFISKAIADYIYTNKIFPQ